MIAGMFEDFRIFRRVRNLDVRQKLESRILHCERILTLASFHKDTIFVERCYKDLQALFPTKSEIPPTGFTTLQEACDRSFRHEQRFFRANRFTARK